MAENLTGQPVSATEPPERNPETSDQNVRTDTVYDKSGNQVETIDPKGITTGLEYDGLGRLNAVVENYKPSYGTTNGQNVTTRS